MAKIRNIFLHIIGTLFHKFWVLFYIFKFCSILIYRGLIHDWSKLFTMEFKYFIRTIHKLKNTTFGSKEYEKLIKLISPAIEHHYKMNRHHPLHFENKIYDMNFHDIIEMWCDWQAAIKRHKDGNIIKSIEYNTKKFNISKQLNNIFKNSVKES